MAKQYNIAYLGIKPGNPDATDYEDMIPGIGLRTYNVPAETVIDIIQNTHKGELNDVQFGLTPEKQCNVMFGGRMFPMFSRDDVVNITSTVDVIIISACVEYYYARSLLMWLNGPNALKDNCIIILRFPFHADEEPYFKTNADQWLSEMGLNKHGESTNAKVSRKQKKKKQSTSRHIFIIGMERYGGVAPDEIIPSLQDTLTSTVAEGVMKPVKETVSAGKSLFGWGQSLANWMSKLVRSN